MVIKTASPGVVIQEVDLTRGTPDAITNNNAFLAGPFKQGPVDEIVKITTEAELVQVFGKPQVEFNQDEYWYSIDNFLEYSGQCYVVRCDDEVGDGEADSTGNVQNLQTMKNAVDNFYYDGTLAGTINPKTGLTYTANELFQSNAYVKNNTQFISLTAGQSVINLESVPQSVTLTDGGENYIVGEASVAAPAGGRALKLNIEEVDANGKITKISILETGSGYSNGLLSDIIQSGVRFHWRF